MTLAEKIIALRKEHNLSQGDLAEKLGVSRQSVSKWETGASTPDLDKMIFLADFFGITLDELVKGETLSEKKEQQADRTVCSGEHTTQKTIAACLMILGGISAILGFAMVPSLLYLAVYLLVCSIICFVVRRYAGLVIAWLTSLGLTILAPYIFGAGIFSYLALAGLLMTILWTIREVRKAGRK